LTRFRGIEGADGHVLYRLRESRAWAIGIGKGLQATVDGPAAPSAFGSMWDRQMPFMRFSV
jgi:hypothetical protein